MVQEVVKATVLNWARAPDFTAANKILAEAREQLTSEQISELQHEVAAINAETFVQLVASKKDSDEDTSVEVEGVPLNPQQLKRISAWIQDQEKLAEALGLDLEAFGALCEEKMKRFVAECRDDDEVSADIAAARKLLGAQGNAHFEERVETGKGFASFLAARNFKKK